MRQMVSITVAALLLVGSLSRLAGSAQEISLLDLLPAAEDIGPAFVVVDDRARTLAEQASGFSNPDEATRLLAGWNWQDNVFKVFQATGLSPSGAPLATIDISLTRFASAEDAALAMPYFLEDRAAVLGQFENDSLTQPPLGDEMRVVSGDVEGGFDTTLYVRSGPLLMRISATAAAGSPHASPEQIAQGIISRFAAFAAPRSVGAAASIPVALPETLPSLGETCSTVAGDGANDVTTIFERFDGVQDAAATLYQMGWVDGVARQFACDSPPVGGVGWVTMSVMRFRDASSAAEAVNFLAASRARVTRLQPAASATLGDSAAALAGPAVNGTEYTLFVSDGPLLYRVTGVAPDGDPRKDVEAIARDLALLNLTVPADVPAAPLASIEPTPTMMPIVTMTPLPTPIPPPTATVAPAAIPAPTATLDPMPTPVPTATTIPTPLPTATAIPTATPPPPTATPDVPPLIPVAVVPQPTATSGPLPTATPRVIHLPTPATD